MGQAERRGTFKERKAAAIKKREILDKKRELIKKTLEEKYTPAELRRMKMNIMRYMMSMKQAAFLRKQIKKGKK